MKRLLLKLAMFVAVLLVFPYFVESEKCNHHQIEVCNEDSTECHCIACKYCPVGYGQVPQCGAQVIMRFPQCVQCKHGKTYSKRHSMESCLPCPVCYGTKTLKPCTTTQPTKCSKECTDGFKFNPITDMCEQKVHISTKAPTPIVIKPKDKRFEDDEHSSLKNQSVLESTKSPVIPDDSQQKTLGAVLGMFGGVAIVCLMLYKKRPNVLKHLVQSLCGQTSAINKDEILLQTQIPDNTLLKSIPPKLRENLAFQLSVKVQGVRGWRDVGYEYQLSKEDLDKIEYYSKKNESSNPGELLLENLNTSKPQETLKQFMAILHKLNRKDLLQMINDEYTQH